MIKNIEEYNTLANTYLKDFNEVDYFTYKYQDKDRISTISKPYKKYEEIIISTLGIIKDNAKYDVNIIDELFILLKIFFAIKNKVFIDNIDFFLKDLMIPALNKFAKKINDLDDKLEFLVSILESTENNIMYIPPLFMNKTILNSSVFSKIINLVEKINSSLDDVDYSALNRKQNFFKKVYAPLQKALNKIFNEDYEYFLINEQIIKDCIKEYEKIENKTTHDIIMLVNVLKEFIILYSNKNYTLPYMDYINRFYIDTSNEYLKTQFGNQNVEREEDNPFIEQINNLGEIMEDNIKSNQFDPFNIYQFNTIIPKDESYKGSGMLDIISSHITLDLDGKYNKPTSGYNTIIDNMMLNFGNMIYNILDKNYDIKVYMPLLLDNILKSRYDDNEIPDVIKEELDILKTAYEYFFEGLDFDKEGNSVKARKCYLACLSIITVKLERYPKMLYLERYLKLEKNKGTHTSDFPADNMINRDNLPKEFVNWVDDFFFKANGSRHKVAHGSINGYNSYIYTSCSMYMATLLFTHYCYREKDFLMGEIGNKWLLS